MTFLSFKLRFELQAQANGTLVATCNQLPILAAGHDADTLADKMVVILKGVVAHLEALDDIAAAKEFLAGNGVRSTVKSGQLGTLGFDESRLRRELTDWASQRSRPSSLQCEIAA
ncbi:MAG: hypothetical protein AB7J35_16100 [Dehalococcoidia bacterium]